MTDNTFKPEEVNEVVSGLKSEVPTQMSVAKRESHLVDVHDLPSDIFNPVVWQHMKGMAETFKASGAFGQSENAATLMVKMQAGREMGMTPIESIKSFYFVKGVINIYGSAVVRRLRNHGWVIAFDEKENICSATIRKGGESYSDVLTFEEADKSGWTKFNGGLKPGWYLGVNRKLKLRYGVLSMIIKTYVPEVLGSAVDIAEVAEDTVPLFSKTTQLGAQNTDDDEPATESQIITIQAMIQNSGDKIEIPEQITKGIAKNMIGQLAQKRKAA